jgi:hypothetical protein
MERSIGQETDAVGYGGSLAAANFQLQAVAEFVAYGVLNGDARA